MPQGHGFTLVELLVVVTIIVVLLALLTPAMNEAVYQAEMAVCATRLKGIATGAQIYAMDFGRHYPYRPGVSSGGGDGWWLPDELRNGTRGTASTAEFDDRRTLRGYIEPKIMLDPLSPRVDISPEATEPGTYVVANYSLRFGFQFFRGSTFYEPMARLGQRLGWPHRDGKDYQFNVLASDSDRAHLGAWSMAGHPDREGVMSPVIAQNMDALPGGAFGTFNLSRWQTPDGRNDRGAIDMNYIFDDGAVRRYERVQWDDWRVDDRMTDVPYYNNSLNEGREWSHMPVKP